MMAPVLPRPKMPEVGAARREEPIVPDILLLLFNQLDAQERVLKAQIETVETSRAVLDAVQRSRSHPEHSEELPAEFSPTEQAFTSESPAATFEPVEEATSVAPHQAGPDKVTKLHFFRRVFHIGQFFVLHMALPRTFDTMLDATSDFALRDYLDHLFDSRMLYHMLFATVSIPVLFEMDEPTTLAEVLLFEFLSWAAWTNFSSIAFLSFVQASYSRVHLVNIHPWVAANRAVFHVQGLVDMANTWAVNLSLLWYSILIPVGHLLPFMLSPVDSSLRTGLCLGRLAVTLGLLMYEIAWTNIASITAEYSGAMASAPLPRGNSISETASVVRSACVGGMNQGRDAVLKYLRQYRANASGGPPSNRSTVRQRRQTRRNETDTWMHFM
eukprot:TRINITY_DN108219_c0_g1_i1.p1 TRINITY_DN108219_c0_g1~~TRINITY_DN108219_c0_g1_i1.p1  ORF type:complete len:385 (-),score=38.23 TRINITY_DN108219_c0_g1_i1:365-1519(-)